ncbi:MAG: hypothetical protein LJF04_18485 [Gemmatimonadetes bacterium]|nr:hypothetical protein [Gemmatimonadota bacterium]
MEALLRLLVVRSGQERLRLQARERVLVIRARRQVLPAPHRRGLQIQ